MAIRFDRLQKIADHLKKGENMNCDKFSFDHVRIENTSCKTLGCAMGEFPAIFKNQWKNVADWYMGGVAKRGSDYFYREDVMQFLGLDRLQMEHIFYPGCQRKEWLKPLSNKLKLSASRCEVYENLQWFIDNNGFQEQVVEKES